MIDIPIVAWEHGKLTLDDTRLSISSEPAKCEVVWSHCFDSLPDHFKSGVWVKKSGREWMSMLLEMHGAKMEPLKNWKHS